MLAPSPLLLGVDSSTADAVENVAPHRALYELSLESAKPNSGVVSASGALGFEWGEACDGWTNEQRFKLTMQYEQDQPLEMTSSLVTWESKDGLSYRFNERRARNGQAEDEIKGTASRAAPDGPGKVIMEKPKAETIDLPAGGLFPTGHTLMLIDKGEAGQNFVSREVFDGSDTDGSSLISAVISPTMNARDTAATVSVKSPLLERPSWNIRLGSFRITARTTRPITISACDCWITGCRAKCRLTTATMSSRRR